MMKFNNRLAIFLCMLLVMACFSSCKEPFDPQVDFTAPLIAVDGLITTEQKSHRVKIHYALNYNQAEVPEPVAGAEVFITDQHGQTDHLREASGQPGHYFTFPDFQALEGRIYTLHIHTREGLELRSRPQEVLPMADIDSIYGQTASRSIMEINSYGDHYFYTYQGGESFVHINRPDGKGVKMRYEPQIMVLYAYETKDTVNSMAPPVWMNCWRKYGAQGLPSVTHLGQQTEISGLKNHLLLFVPENKRFYNLADSMLVAGKYLITRQYRLNEDAHAFYKASVKQLGADGNLFDPIASQLPGNMVCTNDPDQKILGFFEVSSFKSTTYRYLAIPEHNTFIYTPYEDLDHVPSSGALYDERPFFW